MTLFSIPRVLVVVVTYNGKDYCKQEFMNRLDKLTYPKYDYLIVDNTAFPILKCTYHAENIYDGTLLEEISEHKLENKENNSRIRITESYNYARDLFLKEGYDFMFTLEADIIPHKNIIEMLMDYHESIIGAPYFIGFDKDRKLCVFTGNKFKRKSKDGKYIEVYEFLDSNDLGKGIFYTPKGCGLGCLLIDREVIEKVKFRHEDVHCDTYFHQDAIALGYKVAVDTTLVVKHYWNGDAWERMDF
jgi:GT2 family glycosyltransferase